MTKRCAFLTLDCADGYVIDDELAYAPLAALGWRVEAVPWRRPGIARDGFDAVVIRSTWDYHEDPEAFLAVLADIARAGVPLFNDPDLVAWNVRKTYLGDLAARGVPIVPTVFRDRLGAGDLATVFDEIGGDEIVVKPVVGANAHGAFRLGRSTLRDRAREVEAFYAHRALMAQPLARAILSQGEYSLFYFDGELSHGILKTPREADFRVQEEHGGRIRAIEASGALLAAGNAVVATLGVPPLYARVDLVRANAGDGFWLMELELIEPSLYLRMDPGAPGRLARSLDRRVAALRP